MSHKPNPTPVPASNQAGSSSLSLKKSTELISVDAQKWLLFEHITRENFGLDAIDFIEFLQNALDFAQLDLQQLRHFVLTEVA